MIYENKKILKELIPVCLCSAIIGVFVFVGYISFGEALTVAEFGDYSRYPYDFVLSYISTGICLIGFTVLLGLWLTLFLKQNEKIKSFILSVIFFVLGFTVGIPILAVLGIIVKGYISFWESKGMAAPPYTLLHEIIFLDWLNLLGLTMVVLLLIPDIIYAIKNKDQENKSKNTFMNIIKQIGRYGCMFFMIFLLDFAFFDINSLFAGFLYLFGNPILIISYWVIWVLYSDKKTFWKQMALATIQILIFLLNGITQRYVFLIVFAILFGVGNIYITSKNRVLMKDDEDPLKEESFERIDNISDDELVYFGKNSEKKKEIEQLIEKDREQNQKNKLNFRSAIKCIKPSQIVFIFFLILFLLDIPLFFIGPFLFALVGVLLDGSLFTPGPDAVGHAIPLFTGLFFIFGKFIFIVIGVALLLCVIISLVVALLIRRYKKKKQYMTSQKE